MIETDEELRKTFKNFIADFKHFEDWVFIEWHNANGSSNCRVRYIVNEKEGELHISGDLGSAIFYWHAKNTWQDIAKYSKHFSYFKSKAEANSDDGMTDSDVAEEDLHDFIQEYVDDETLKELGYTEDEFIEEAMAGWDIYGDGYTMVKVKTTGTRYERWRLKHVLVWEEHNGPVPKDCIVTFLDGNRDNFDINNLACIRKGVNSVLNTKKLRSKQRNF